jgi:hypothetical protein
MGAVNFAAEHTAHFTTRLVVGTGDRPRQHENARDNGNPDGCISHKYSSNSLAADDSGKPGGKFYSCC